MFKFYLHFTFSGVSLDSTISMPDYQCRRTIDQPILENRQIYA